MIIEMRTYTLKPGTVAEVEKRVGEALPMREKHSKLAAWWHTEVGQLNQVVHIWPYDSVEQRTAIRAAAARDPGWPPPVGEFILDMQNELLLPAPFSPALEPRQAGPLFELRQYTLTLGAIPGLIERWSEKIDARTKLSPLIGGWYSEFGTLNKWVHIWAYKDAAERFAVREAARAGGNWPARNPPGVVLRQENALMLPAAFSRIR